MANAPRTTYPGISPNAWEHPADRVALNALRQIPVLDRVVQFLVGNTTEQVFRLLNLAGSVRVSEKQFARVHNLAHECYRILDVPVERQPEIYVTQNPTFNAMCYGVDRPFLVFNSALVKSLSDDELLAVIAHEMGHALSGHALYRTLLDILVRYSGILVLIPVGNLGIIALTLALLEWSRKAELSCDRAALLVVQDVDAYVRTMMKLAGGDADQMDVQEFIAQADEYERNENVRDQIYKFLILLPQTHPFAALRVKEILNWSTSGEYEAILKGSYPTNRTDYYEDLKRTADSYTKGTGVNTDRVTEAFKEVADKAQDFFKNLFGGGGDDDKDGGKRA